MSLLTSAESRRTPYFEMLDQNRKASSCFAGTLKSHNTEKASRGLKKRGPAEGTWARRFRLPTAGSNQELAGESACPTSVLPPLLGRDLDLRHVIRRVAHDHRGLDPVAHVQFLKFGLRLHGVFHGHRIHPIANL